VERVVVGMAAAAEEDEQNLPYAQAYDNLKAHAHVCRCVIWDAIPENMMGIYSFIRDGEPADHIYIKRDLSIKEKLFTLAHEMGHGFVIVNKTSFKRRKRMGGERSANIQALRILKALDVPDYEADFKAYVEAMTQRPWDDAQKSVDWRTVEAAAATKRSSS